ncbi:TAT-variant-translocated molybdopterin oxidoreductase [Singulisphaera acidiphila]|uniref:Fe-S-cluster-containing hydrogenase subunit n=1 Tax=Singulisphaera acidiphila (strain ATCC BAA-1392 / DSM 18658 / VKM B-2454 / MOB10) TaxID=886293 RepID=L0DGI6_SINAD|nr:TAT-variant-translocated molybdopterin oxidoreductase [Singulisphaera acidiphila]AGA27913.1 Fe-S-cluster-containing hydrogenase subunit [Singulisphaera acidiphila DSM 18658]
MMIHSRKTDGLDLASLRERLAGQRGPRYWRSLEELAETEEFQSFLDREFPHGAPELVDATSRRNFLKLMGASLALAGVSGCTHQASEKIVPYVRAPESLVPGKPLYYATAISRSGSPIGVLAESHMGRPTMVEGNEKHPDSLGAIDYFAQAAVLTLYDPDRSQVVTRRGGQISTWDAFLTEAVAALDAQRPNKGRGVRILTETVTSRSLGRQIRAFLEDFPEATWHQYEPAGRDTVRAGARLAFGRDVATRYHVAKADVIFALGSDFLAEGPGHLRSAREFAARRETLESMNRLYVVETTPTITGSMADHRLAASSYRIADFASFLARELEVKVSAPGGALSEPEARWVRALAKDLRKSQGKALVIAGEEQPPLVHALAHALNQVLGSVGTTVVYTDPVEEQPVNQAESIRTLANDLEAGKVDVLLVLGGNPAYDAPVDLNFGPRIAKAKFSAHLGLYEDETAALCRWHLPETHELEAWGDVRASDGTVTIQQPLIAPLYDGRSALELIAGLLRHPDRSGYEIVRETWKDQAGTADFETFWRTAVHDGVVEGTGLPPRSVSLTGELAQAGVPRVPQGEELEIVFRTDPTIWDGRYANNGWLQELPKPLTKMTWDNVAQFAPAAAERLGLNNGDLVELRYKGRSVEAPVWISPGHAESSVTVTLGYGRTRAGRVGNGAGFSAYRLRTSEAPWFDAGLEIRKTGRTFPLANTELHRNVLSLNETGEAAEERHLVRVGTIGEYHAEPHFAQHMEHAPKPKDSLYPEILGSVDRLDVEQGATMPPGGSGYAWGMAINLNACIGCGVCVVACQAENNIPIVGKEEVSHGREMQWIDIDRYYHGDLDNPEVYHQPRTCMHCENAPCEVVCPVAATVHDDEGINNMVYNRCVGTRYCGNNCPYKVRHFNFFHYSKPVAESLVVLNNPDVTVRARGVMEKCTFCIQRVNAARTTAEIEGRSIRDGEVKTACQSACPTRAIVFGNVNDPNSQVSKLKDDPRNYGILTELNTRPRTTYLARLRNPNPELETESRDGV